MRRAKYFTETPYGTRGSIRIGGILYQKHFRHGTDPADRWQWLADTQQAHLRGPTESGSFADDARRYLQAVAAMPSYSDRKRHIDAWSTIFPTVQRTAISSAAIAAQLQIWRQTKSASTCNHLRTALQHLWTTLDGKAANNPVRDVPKFAEPSTVPRHLAYRIIRKLLRAVPDPVDRARLTLIAYAGLPNALIASITPAHINRKARTLSLPGRKKGHGTRGQVIPLRPEALAALKVLEQRKAFGPFSRWHLRKVFKQACVTAKVTGTYRPYDLRHSFATELYRNTGDIGAVQTLMLHSSAALTMRYSMGAVSTRTRKALKDFGS